MDDILRAPSPCQSQTHDELCRNLKVSNFHRYTFASTLPIGVTLREVRQNLTISPGGIFSPGFQTVIEYSTGSQLKKKSDCECLSKPNTRPFSTLLFLKCDGHFLLEYTNSL